MKVSIVIPTKNGADTIGRCLESIFSQIHRHELQVIIIDSGSQDGTLEIVKKFPVFLETIPPHEFNHGLTRNKGISLASGELVVLTVQDAVPQGTDWLNGMVRWFDDPAIAGVYCRQVPYETCDPLRAIQILQSFPAGDSILRKRIPDRESFAALSPWEKLEVVTFDNVCSCIKKSIWLEFPFDRVEFAEDLRWALKVLLAGKEIVYNPAVSVMHSHNPSLRALYNRERISHYNAYKLIGLQTMEKFTLKRSFEIIIETWQLIWRHDYRWGYMIYYLLSPLRNLVSHLGQYRGARTAKKEMGLGHSGS